MVYKNLVAKYVAGFDPLSFYDPEGEEENDHAVMKITQEVLRKLEPRLWYRKGEGRLIQFLFSPHIRDTLIGEAWHGYNSGPSCRRRSVPEPVEQPGGEGSAVGGVTHASQSAAASPSEVPTAADTSAPSAAAGAYCMRAAQFDVGEYARLMVPACDADGNVLNFEVQIVSRSD